MNKIGYTALDVLDVCPRDFKCFEIQNIRYRQLHRVVLVLMKHNHRRELNQGLGDGGSVFVLHLLNT